MRPSPVIAPKLSRQALLLVIGLLGLFFLTVGWKKAFEREEKGAVLGQLTPTMVQQRLSVVGDAKTDAKDATAEKSTSDKVGGGLAATSEKTSNKAKKARKDKVAAEKRADSALVLRESAAGLSDFRRLLLEEAAHRASRSLTSWSDLAETALGYHRAGMPDEARYWFGRAFLHALVPSDLALSGTRQIDVVKRLLETDNVAQARRFIERIGHPLSQAKAQAQLVTAITKQRSPDLVEALEISLQITDEQQQVRALETLARYELRKTKVETALQSLSLMQAGGYRDAALSRLAPVVAKKGGPQAVLNLVGHIDRAEPRDQALARAALEQARLGRPFQQLIDALADGNQRDQTLRRVVESQKGGFPIWQRATVASQIQGPRERARAEEALVRQQARRGDLRGALRRAQTIADAAARDRALQALSIEEARIVGLRRARSTAGLIQPGAVRDTAMRRLAERAARDGQPQRAQETINDVTDPGQRALGYAQMALEAARGGDERGAYRLAQASQREMQHENVPARLEAAASGILAETYLWNGEVENALNSAAEIQHSSARDRTYQRLVEHLGRSQEIELAEETAHRIGTPRLRQRALSRVASQLADQVPDEEAFEAVETFAEASDQVTFLVAMADR